MQICKKTGGGTMEVQKVQRTTLTMKEASEYLGISYCKVGGKYLFRVQALDEYLKNMELQSMN